MRETVLTGIDGANPLGFFAALGVLEVVSDRGLPARLAWRDEGAWRPILSGLDASVDDLVEWVEEDRLTCLSEPALALEYGGKRDLKPPPGQFREYLLTLVAAAQPGSRRSVDWASSFATDIAVDNNGNTKPTALHFTAGQQLFLKMVDELATGVTASDVSEALIGPWRYERPLPVMGWDATAARSYALRASNPSGDKKLGVPAADWLAVRGMVSLPVVPVGSRVLTTGCTGGWKTGAFAWPLWSVALERSVVRSTVRLDLGSMDDAERRARGIAVVFRCGIKRTDQGGYGSFEPASVFRKQARPSAEVGRNE
ncbi:MAG: hypothetical protein H6719_28120 [Sandaracinaceae bacterium]|nr:hypothetical protein [Sandaracinaceae bacterium]